MNPDRWLDAYRPGTLDKLSDLQRTRERRERIVLWVLWGLVCLIVAYGAVIGVLALVGR